MGRNVKKQGIETCHIVHFSVSIRKFSWGMSFEKIQPALLCYFLDTAFPLADKIPKFILCFGLCTSESKPDDGVFRIVYTGALSVVKGVPLLLDAFARQAGMI